MISGRGYVDLGVLDMLSRTNKRKIDDIIQNRINYKWQISGETTNISFAFMEFPLMVFIKYLSYFKQKNINLIKRMYDKPDYTREEFKKTSRVYDLYSDNAIIDNLRLLYSKLESAYNDVVLNSFPQLKEKLIPFADSDKFIIEMKKRDRTSEDITPFKQYRYYLKSRADRWQNSRDPHSSS